MRAEEEVRGDDRFQSQPEDLPEPGRRAGAEAIDQLWLADITYIRLEEEFVYLAVILDAYSRRVIGWALDRTLEDDFDPYSTRHGLEARQPKPGLVHHSDRGSNTLRTTTRIC